MKYMIVLGDGMADEPIESLGGKTPLMYAKTPVMDMLAEKSEIGLSYTIPDGMKPGSDVANLAVLGYYPAAYYSGRSPLEALSIGVDLKPTDIAMRTNLVTISDEPGIPFEERTILDHSAGEISTEEAAQLIDSVKDAFETQTHHFYVGTSYRHLLIWEKGEILELSQPHDVLGSKIGVHMPSDPILHDMMKRSFDILDQHPINQARAKAGLNKANCLWFWGAGTKPALTSFYEKTGKKGAMISAVDLLKGIAVGANMDVIEVEGANAQLETNYEGKAMAAVKALKDGADFAYIHIEAPDEMGHQGSIEKKIKAIEYIDSRVIKVLMYEMERLGEPYRMLVMPDHPTPICCRTHTASPVPFMLYDRLNEKCNHGATYDEAYAASTGLVIKEGWHTIDRLFGQTQK